MEQIPPTYRKLIATVHGKNYRNISRIVEVPLELPGAGELLVRNHYAGINASDINLTSGAYGNLPSLPMDLGVEAVGEVVAIGEGVEGWQPGDAIAYLSPGAYGEYNRINARVGYHLPRPSKEALPLVASAMTAAVGLNHVGDMGDTDLVLVTGAAGGTGQFAVQLAKLAGNHVIALCGGEDKAAMLRSLGADRVINYHHESLDQILSQEYPKGVDLIYECIGGEVFDICLEHIGFRGRLLIVGYISEYLGEPDSVLAPRVYTKLLWKSASIRGFIASAYPRATRDETERLIKLWQNQQLISKVDTTPFEGVEAIPDALDHLYGGRSLGKVIVNFPVIAN